GVIVSRYFLIKSLNLRFGEDLEVFSGAERIAVSVSLHQSSASDFFSKVFVKLLHPAILT
ncbi:MAG: hypothetical protein P8L79_11155, partial [Rhodospirillaceae bacterium]|nr:hypothetical protein [Rhodospirillaceae bacterium]